MKSSRFLLATLLAALLSQAQADDISGPHRMTLSDEAWGTIFYVPSELHDYRYVRNIDAGQREMTSSLGKVKIVDSGIGSFDVEGPKATIKVEGSSSAVKVTFMGKSYEFIHQGQNLTVRAPKNEITYKILGEDMSVEGTFGKTMIHNKDGVYSVTSPKGRYSYTPIEGGGFEVKGGPLMKHPGLYRGALFKTAGVGVFIDFRKLDPDNPLFHFLEFTPLLEYPLPQGH